MKTFTTATLLAGIFALSGCASTGNITPQYVPPSTYQNYNCQALGQEYTRVNRYVEAARNEQSTIGIRRRCWCLCRTLGYLAEYQLWSRQEQQYQST